MIAALRDRLSTGQKSRVLEDLQQIAGADGVLLQDERGLLSALAQTWGVEVSDAAAAAGAPEEGTGAPWGVLHDLAYIYVHLAHGTDHELSTQEVQVMVNKLREWQPEETDEPTEGILEAALEAYGRGGHSDMFERAIASVRRVLPHPERMAALNDLVKIANADGVFLDDEEDMINNLVAAWDVDPSASYKLRGGA